MHALILFLRRNPFEKGVYFAVLAICLGGVV